MSFLRLILSLSGAPEPFFETFSGLEKFILNFSPFSVNSVHSHVKLVSLSFLPLSFFSSFWSPPLSTSSFSLPSSDWYFIFSISFPGKFPFPKTKQGVLNRSSNSPVWETLPGFAKNLGGGVFGGGSNFLASLFFLVSFLSSYSDNLFVSILAEYFAAATEAPESITLLVELASSVELLSVMPVSVSLLLVEFALSVELVSFKFSSILTST